MPTSPTRALWATTAFFATLAGAAGAQERIEVPRADRQPVPLRIFAPSPRGCAPLALISPGAGGTEKGLGYLAEGLRDKGWLAIVVGHRESGPAALREHGGGDGLKAELQGLTTDPAAYRSRLLDISAALNWAELRCKPPARVLLGHSMGAATVMIEAGARNRLGVTADDRFDAYVAMSPQGPGSIFPPQAWVAITKPLLILTGTRDKALEGDWQTRTIPFASLPPGCKWLGVIDGASHMNFAGIGFAANTERLTLTTVSAFLDAYRQRHCEQIKASSGMTLEAK